MKVTEKHIDNLTFYNVSSGDFSITFCSLGASIYSIKYGNDYLVMTTKNTSDFIPLKHYHGKTIGRVANRTAGNELLIKDKKYCLENNEECNVLHGGIHAISSQIFQCKVENTDKCCKLTFHYLSKDGEAGYPGNLNLDVLYIIGIDNTLEIKYQYSVDQLTPVSLTNHSYFTLGSKSLDELELFINSDMYHHPNPNDLLFVENRKAMNEMDFTSFKPITRDIDNRYLQNSKTKGYDHYFLFKKVDPNSTQFALRNDKYLFSAITNYPGVQIYTDNYEDDVEYFGTNLKKYRGIAVEFGLPHDIIALAEPNRKYEYFMKYSFNKLDNLDRRTLFNNVFNKDPEYSVSSGGRVEMIGNHTDHNHGLCCAFTCNLAIKGFLGTRNDNKVVCLSKGYSPVELNLNNLEKKNEEATSIGLIRGIARYFKEHNYQIGGFNLVTESTIFAGAGVSSSAAFETLIGQIFNMLYNENKIDKLLIAKAGQYAENTDFGKKSGLLDQIGTGYGNMSFIDFKDINNPVVEKLAYPFDDLNFVIVNTGGSHAKLSHLYSSIPEDMWNAARKMGHNFLRDCDETKLNDVDLTIMERNRAIHFFNENKRVLKLKEAIQTKNKQKFLDTINESRMSSVNFLKNMMVGDQYLGSPQEACDFAMSILEKQGACRINGGGFAGSIICVVPNSKLDIFIQKMSHKYGKENVAYVYVDTIGPIIKKL